MTSKILAPNDASEVSDKTLGNLIHPEIRIDFFAMILNLKRN
jgi:hypothetical protein